MSSSLVPRLLVLLSCLWVVNAASLAKRQDNTCTKTRFCTVVQGTGGAVVRAGAAVSVGAQVLGQNLGVIVCDYTTVLGANVVGTNTCVYLGTSGLLNTNTNVALNVNGVSGFSCPSSLSCGVAPPQASLASNPSPQTCLRRTCAASTVNGVTLSNTLANQAATVGGTLLGVNVLVCQYNGPLVSLAGISLGTGLKTCIYAGQAGLTGVLSNVVGDVTGLAAGLLNSVGNIISGFNCPQASSLPAPTCSAPSGGLVVLSRRAGGAQKWEKKMLQETIAKRQWNPRTAKPAGATRTEKTGSLRRRR